MRGTRPRSADAVHLRRASWRMGLQVGSCVAAIVIVLSAVAVLIVLRSQDTALVTLLEQSVARADDVVDPPAGLWLTIQKPARTESTPGLPAGFPDRSALARATATGTSELVTVTVAGSDYRVYTARREGETLQAVASLQTDYDERTRLLEAMLATGVLGLALAVAAGAWFGRRAVRPMAAALALQRRFVADASHELRTPLTLLSTRTQLLRRHLRRGVDTDDLADEVDGVVTDARQLADILNDLLLAADTRDTTAGQETIDIVALVTQVVAAGAPAAAEQATTVHWRPAQPSLPVRGTLGGLRRALNALLDNATRHARSTVTVTAARVRSEVVIEVADDGPGLDPELLPHLFERFVSNGVAEQRRYGLGLALVGEIAARHGGSVSADNAPGGGAVLRLTLPVLRGETV